MAPAASLATSSPFDATDSATDSLHGELGEDSSGLQGELGEDSLKEDEALQVAELVDNPDDQTECAASRFDANPFDATEFTAALSEVTSPPLCVLKRPRMSHHFLKRG